MNEKPGSKLAHGIKDGGIGQNSILGGGKLSS